MKPIRILWLGLAIALAWGGWWAYGAWSERAGLVAWLEDRRAEGWQAEWDSVDVRGFPNRIDLTINAPVLANTEGGWAWSGAFFQVLELSYRRDHVILVWPDESVLQTPWQRIAITGEDLKASVTLLPGRARELDTATLVFKDLAFASDAGWTSSMTELRLATRPTEGRDGTRDIGLEIVGLKPRSKLIESLAEAGLVPGEVDQLKADLAVAFDRPWDLSALQGERPQPRLVEIREAAAKWGELELRVAGDLTVDDGGTVSGEIMVKATNWREMLELARRSGAIPEGLVSPIESALTLLSRLAGRSDTLDIPVTFADGRTRIGVVPLGPAPVLRLP